MNNELCDQGELRICCDPCTSSFKQHDDPSFFLRKRSVRFQSALGLLAELEAGSSSASLLFSPVSCGRLTGGKFFSHLKLLLFRQSIKPLKTPRRGRQASLLKRTCHTTAVRIRSCRNKRKGTGTFVAIFQPIGKNLHLHEWTTIFRSANISTGSGCQLVLWQIVAVRLLAIAGTIISSLLMLQ